MRRPEMRRRPSNEEYINCCPVLATSLTYGHVEFVSEKKNFKARNVFVRVLGSHARGFATTGHPV